MKNGKTPENVYERSVVKELHLNEGRVVSGAETYGDICASFDISDNEEFLVSRGFWASIREINGARAVISAVNSLLADGATPKTVMLTILTPLKYSEEKLKKILRSINEVCECHGVSISRYTGENTSSVNEPCIMAVAIGIIDKDIRQARYAAKASPGDDIVMTGYAGLSGSVTVATLKYEELIARYPKDYIENLMAMKESAYVGREAALAIKSGACVVKQVSKGGVYAALWELGRDLGVGLEVNLKDITLKQETVEVCNHIDLNPYELDGEGSLIITAKDGYALADTLCAAGFVAQVIGKINDNNDRVVINDTERKFLTMPCPDELTKIM